MARFDFIAGEDFRASLDSDYQELLAAMQHGMWKTVHVLSGSIIEAVLVDYLIAVGYQSRSSKDPLNMTLHELIAACKSEGILSQRSADLSAVVKDYRNLIHPGRIIRLQETVDENGAKVALALVEIIVKDVEGTKKRIYGSTAEQIASKIEHDSSVVGVIEHILKDVSPHELERLLVVILPHTYFTYVAKETGYASYTEIQKRTAMLTTLVACFRRIFEFAPDNVKRKATQNFVRVIKEETKTNVLAYEANLFSAQDLQYLEPDDAQLVKQHLLVRLHTDREMELNDFLSLIGGLGAYIEGREASTFTDDVMHVISRSVSNDNAVDFANRVIAEYALMNADVQFVMSERVKVWAEFFESRKQEMDAEIARRLHRALIPNLDDIPF